MNAFHRAVLMLRRSKKESGSLIFTFMLSIGLLFLFMNMQVVETPQKQSAGYGFMDLDSMVLSMYTLMIIIVCTINSFIANNYFLKSKALEICVYLSNGMNVWGLARYIFLQNFLILIVSTILGGGLGLLLHPLLNFVMIHVLHISIPIFHITGMGIAMWLITAAYQCFFMIMFNVGYAYKAELKDLLDVQREAPMKDVRMFTISHRLYYLIYAFGILAVVVFPAMSLFYLLAIIIGIYGMQGILRYGIIDHIEKKKRTHSHMDCVKLVAIGNFKASLKAVSPFMLMIFGAWLFMVCFSSAENTSSYIRFVLSFGYVLMALMMLISMYFKLMSEAKKRSLEFYRLRLIGYKEDLLKACVNQEFVRLFGLMLILPLPYAVLISVKYLMSGLLPWWNFAFLLCSYLGMLGIMALLSFKSYRKEALFVPEGGERDE